MNNEVGMLHFPYAEHAYVFLLTMDAVMNNVACKY